MPVAAPELLLEELLLDEEDELLEDELDELLLELEELEDELLDDEELLLEELELDEEDELLLMMNEPAGAVRVTRSSRAPSSRLRIRSVWLPAAKLVKVTTAIVP